MLELKSYLRETLFSEPDQENYWLAIKQHVQPSFTVFGPYSLAEVMSRRKQLMDAIGAKATISRPFPAKHNEEAEQVALRYVRRKAT